MQKYICKTCGYVYDPAFGDSEAGIEAGIPFLSRYPVVQLRIWNPNRN